MVQPYRAEEDDWLTVLRKKQQPKNQSTLVLRPQDGFVLATHRPAALMMAIESTANLLQSEAKAIYVDVPRHQNIAVIKSLRYSATKKIVRITGIYIGGQIRRVRIYATAPEDSCRGIVHGIEVSTSPEQLTQNLCAPNTDFLSARMMGKSETALSTFRGTYVPRFVLYHRAKYDCKPHKPKAQFFFTCCGIGHRADICPQAGVIKCKACGSLLDTPDQEHSCSSVAPTARGNIQRTTPHVQPANKLTPRHPRRLTTEGETFNKHDKSRSQGAGTSLWKQHTSRMPVKTTAVASHGRSGSHACTNGNRRARSLSLRGKRRSVSRSALPPINPSVHKNTRKYTTPTWQSDAYKRALLCPKPSIAESLRRIPDDTPIALPTESQTGDTNIMYTSEVPPIQNSEEESPRRTSLTQKRKLDNPPSKRQCAVVVNNQELNFSELKTQISVITAKLQAATKAAEELEKKTEGRFIEIKQKAEQSASQLALMMEKIEQSLKAVHQSQQDIQRRLDGLESTPSSAHRFTSPRSHPYASEANQRQRTLHTNNGDN
ncbi:hypothetical protein HPB48_011311 [Haemaphysalis longicornis]|uniref:Uncharacterized protein n=1 Tax=Haemaphysalis longicornis TaxID=44386 RepID=A0A9J6GAR2_HAELO|nr:hypothetical protein HPB48_011311 [Haemaphysalis longicornis]